MGTSFKFKKILDSTGVVHRRELLSDILEQLQNIKIIEKTLNITQANTWFDTGITGDLLASGTYIMEVENNGQSANSAYYERISGVVAWFYNQTNDDSYDDIPD